MKRIHWTILLISTIMFMPNFSASAQKFGYVDTEFILGKMDEYKKAKAEMDKLSAEWQTEVEGMLSELDKELLEYQKEELYLTDDMKKVRQDTLDVHRKKVKEHQDEIFGYNGLVFLKRQELMQPVQEKIFDAVEKVCKLRKLAFMFDKAGDMTMLYSSKAHDYTDYVLEELGLGDPADTVDNPKHKKKKY